MSDGLKVDAKAFAELQHEAGDRVHVLSSTFADFVQAHPFIHGRPELAAQAEAIGNALGDMYQAIWTTTEQT